MFNLPPITGTGELRYLELVGTEKILRDIHGFEKSKFEFTAIATMHCYTVTVYFFMLEKNLLLNGS